MMQIKSVEPNDIIDILNLNDKQDFKLKNLKNSIIDKIVYDENKNLIAYGIVKRMAEAIILTNPEVSLLKRGEAMRELMKYAELGAARENCEQLHCFLSESNEKLTQTLISKFGFVRTKDIVLVKQIL